MKKKNWNGFLIAGCALTGLLIALMLLGKFWTPWPPTAMDPKAMYQPPSFTHLFGTDKFGRDISAGCCRAAAPP